VAELDRALAFYRDVLSLLASPRGPGLARSRRPWRYEAAAAPATHDAEPCEVPEVGLPSVSCGDRRSQATCGVPEVGLSSWPAVIGVPQRPCMIMDMFRFPYLIFDRLLGWLMLLGRVGFQKSACARDLQRPASSSGRA
jgi:hypothetical protein